MKLQLADDPINSKYWDMAFKWANQQDWDYYTPDKYPAIKGVPANQDGFTLFYSYVGREYVKTDM